MSYFRKFLRAKAIFSVKLDVSRFPKIFSLHAIFFRLILLKSVYPNCFASYYKFVFLNDTLFTLLVEGFISTDQIGSEHVKVI